MSSHHYTTIACPMVNLKMVWNQTVWRPPRWHSSKRHPFNNYLPVTKYSISNPSQENDLAITKSSISWPLWKNDPDCHWPPNCHLQTIAKKQPSGYHIVFLLPSSRKDLMVAKSLIPQPSWKNDLTTTKVSSWNHCKKMIWWSLDCHLKTIARKQSGSCQIIFSLPSWKNNLAIVRSSISWPSLENDLVTIKLSNHYHLEKMI
jgi:hypothetical protein